MVATVVVVMAVVVLRMVATLALPLLTPVLPMAATAIGAQALPPMPAAGKLARWTGYLLWGGSRSVYFDGALVVYFG
jgi:hypothetical protein